MRAIAFSYGFKVGNSALKKGNSTFPKGTNNVGKRQNHLATPVCSSFLDVSNRNNCSWNKGWTLLKCLSRI